MRLLTLCRHYLSELMTLLMRRLPVKNRVLFYTIRADNAPLDNLKCVYDALQCKKVLFAKMLPHSFGDMLLSRYYLLTSRVIVTDDYIRYLRQLRLHPSQKVVQLWHAAGALKKFALDAPSRLTAEEERRTHDQYTAVLVSGDSVRQVYAGAFGIDEKKVLPLGVPRTDRLLDPSWQSLTKNEVLLRAPALQGKTVYLYAPTFRETEGTVTDFDAQIDFVTLNNALHDDEIFVVRRHPVMKQPLFSASFSRVIDLSELPTLSLLTVADVLVTDYSSLIFDAALLQKKILLYCPDLEAYERSFYLDYPSALPARCVKDSAALLQELRNTLALPDEEEKRTSFSTQLSACDGKSTARAVELIQDYFQ